MREHADSRWAELIRMLYAWRFRTNSSDAPSPLFLEMLVVGRVVRRDRNTEARMISAMFTRGKRLAFHHRHLVLVLMDSVMHHIVDSRLGTEIAGFELIHKD
jgi:hypothetical protein